MTTSGPSTPRSTSSQPVTALPRGKACIACRRRKVRCDGTRPICGQCIRTNRPDDCEYTDGQGRSRMHMLEENITRLQARVEELEHPEQTTPAVALHHPYSSPGDSQGSSTPFDFQPFYLPPSISSTSSPGSSLIGVNFNPNSWWTRDEPPRHVVLESLNKILPYVDELGFFLHATSESARGIPLALQNAIILLCFHITETNQSTVELELLSTSLRQLADIVPSCSASTRNLLHVLQTEVLLTHYLFRVGRTVEARYHLGAAVSLVLAFRLHSSSPLEGESNRPEGMQSMLFDVFSTTLPNPLNDIEQTETVHAFWTVFVRDKSMSAVLGVPPCIGGSVRITVPWPGRIPAVNSSDQDIQRMNSGQEVGSQTDTIKYFLDGGSSDDINGESLSTLAFHAKAAVLLDKANNLVSQYTLDPRIHDSQSFRTQFIVLDALIEHLKLSIPSNSSLSTVSSPSFSQSSSTAPSTQLVSHHSVYIQSLLALATIRLNSPFRESYALSNIQSVDAAMLVARNLQGVNLNKPQFFDPVIIIWISASFVIHAEITRLRARNASWATQFPVHELVQALRTILDVLRDIADRCPVLALRRKLETVLPLLDYLSSQ
ncbi:uncharacterized protein EDB91DRAFT_1156909 [Suillus paluster]|uniref:uncharacterized protein n=1 Tax=Suillus paluster TaxID=48578 RepID=UPI001B88674C|nr:uncharacterized protein EDB91DRAFT_1156909 [Suillus paluster]KAG1730532.1 hypothetical protein EDB91DRAFT_1156909 [Suillus paluster]